MDDKANVYRKLTAALERSHFHLHANDLSRADLVLDREALNLVIRAAAAAIVPGAIRPSFDQNEVQRQLDTVRQWATLVGVKYVLGQPVLAAVIEADQLSHDELARIVMQFDEVILGMLRMTATLGGIEIGRFRLGGTRMSATGIIMSLFFDHEAASRFIEHAQRRCKIWHFWKKTWVLPWVIDVSDRTVKRHPGLPFLPSVLSTGYLQKELFS